MTQAYSIYFSIVTTKGCYNTLQGGIGLAIYDENGLLVDEINEKVLQVSDSAELEVIALIEALEYAQNGDWIFSSSEYCVKGYNKWLDNWKAKGWRKSGRKLVVNKYWWQQVDALRETKLVGVKRAKACESAQRMFIASEIAKGRTVEVWS